MGFQAVHDVPDPGNVDCTCTSKRTIFNDPEAAPCMRAVSPLAFGRLTCCRIEHTTTIPAKNTGVHKYTDAKSSGEVVVQVGSGGPYGGVYEFQNQKTR